jgi:hypothetical protein
LRDLIDAKACHPQWFSTPFCQLGFTSVEEHPFHDFVPDLIEFSRKPPARSSTNASPSWARPTCSSTATRAWPAPLSSSGASNDVQEFWAFDAAGKDLMRTVVRPMELRARAYRRVLNLVRTIADLAGEAEIRTEHLTEALQNRPRGGA